MSDGIPGSSHDNPIWHRGYRIHLNDGSDVGPFRGGYVFVHDDYDPTPVHSGDGPSDHRYGFARTVDEAKSEIDDMEEAEAA